MYELVKTLLHPPTPCNTLRPKQLLLRCQYRKRLRKSRCDLALVRGWLAIPYKVSTWTCGGREGVKNILNHSVIHEGVNIRRHFLPVLSANPFEGR